MSGLRSPLASGTMLTPQPKLPWCCSLVWGRGEARGLEQRPGSAGMNVHTPGGERHPGRGVIRGADDQVPETVAIQVFRAADALTKPGGVDPGRGRPEGIQEGAGGPGVDEDLAGMKLIGARLVRSRDGVVAVPIGVEVGDAGDGEPEVPGGLDGGLDAPDQLAGRPGEEVGAARGCRGCPARMCGKARPPAVRCAHHHRRREPPRGYLRSWPPTADRRGGCCRVRLQWPRRRRRRARAHRSRRRPPPQYRRCHRRRCPALRSTPLRTRAQAGCSRGAYR